MTFTVKTPYATYEGCHFSVNEYANNDHIAIEIWSDTDGPIADLTVNVNGINGTGSLDMSCVDTNNCPWATKLINELGIGRYTGCVMVSGFCEYPVYEFDRDSIEKYVGG